MQIRVFGPLVAACLLAVAGEALVPTRAFGYQELSCRRACLAAQDKAERRCAGNCYPDRYRTGFYCYNLCIGRGR